MVSTKFGKPWRNTRAILIILTGRRRKPKWKATNSLELEPEERSKTANGSHLEIIFENLFHPEISWIFAMIVF
jgi:hypothetical protein